MTRSTGRVAGERSRLLPDSRTGFPSSPIPILKSGLNFLTTLWDASTLRVLVAVDPPGAVTVLDCLDEVPADVPAAPEDSTTLGLSISLGLPSLDLIPGLLVGCDSTTLGLSMVMVRPTSSLSYESGDLERVSGTWSRAFATLFE